MTADRNSRRLLVGHSSFDAAMVVEARGEILLFDFLAQGNYQIKEAGEVIGYKKRNPNRRDLLNHTINRLCADYSQCIVLGTFGGKGSPFSPLVERLDDGESIQARYRSSGNFRFGFWIQAHSLTTDIDAFLKAAGLKTVHQRMPPQTDWPQTILTKADEPTGDINKVPPRMRLVPVEAATKESFTVAAPSSEPRVATRSESLLVDDFNQWLRKNGVESCSALYAIPGGTLRSDLFIQEWNLLVEAKATNSRESIRTAIGQLFDYRRFHDSAPDLAVLVPEKPEEDLVELLEGLGFQVWFRESDGFAATTLFTFQRKRGDKR